jgi:NhaP-type Na+/H+ or K+/H+ antiporter/Trk K+ transport system NAD-binding subunit
VAAGAVMSSPELWVPLWHEVSHNLATRPGLVLFAMSVVVVVGGLAAQILAYRLAVPSIIFMLVTGIVLGPDGLGIVQPELYRHGLRTIITGCVAIIVFESVLRIDLQDLKRVSRPVLGLSTVGVGITTVCGALLAQSVVGLPMPVAFLFGAVVSITGPTVIIPIVRRLSLSPQLKTTLEGESIFADAVGVILAASIFSYVSDMRFDAANGIWLFLSHLGLGVLTGIVIAYLGRWTLARLAPLPGEYIRLGVLSTALVVYACAELITRHLGIMAVAVAAIVFGLKPLPYTETIKQFKGDLTLICLSLVFILLAANLPVRSLFQLGWSGVVVVFVLMLLVRPLCVFVSTWGSELTLREKAFLSALGPRGIVVASAATFFALELDTLGMPGGDALKGLAFLVVIFTVTIEGAGAPWVARKLGVVPPRTVVLGGDRPVRRYAQALRSDGQALQLLDESIENVHQLLMRNLPARLLRFTDTRALLRWCHPRTTGLVLVATEDDARNLQLGGLIKARYPELPVQVRLQDPARLQEAQALALTPWLPEAEDLPAAPPLTAPSNFDEMAEAVVRNPALQGLSVSELDVPPGSLLVALKREGRVLVPRGTTTLAVGDVITIGGEGAAVEKARYLLEGN